MTTRVLITLVVPPVLEDACIELLLEHPSTPAFSSTPARGHGDDPAHLSLSEQVSGWRREVRIEVEVADEDRRGLLDALRERLPTPAVRWRVTPVLDAGDFGAPAP
jgi:hypothetical protein